MNQYRFSVTPNKTVPTYGHNILGPVLWFSVCVIRGTQAPPAQQTQPAGALSAHGLVSEGALSPLIFRLRAFPQPPQRQQVLYFHTAEVARLHEVRISNRGWESLLKAHNVFRKTNLHPNYQLNEQSPCETPSALAAITFISSAS